MTLNNYLSLCCLLVALPIAAKPGSVALAVATPGSLQGELKLTGELRPLRSTVLSAEVAGSVAEVLVERGDRVLDNGVLAVIRSQPAQYTLKAAQGRAAEATADVERAVINERRIGRLLQRKAASEDEYDTVQVELDKAQAILSTRRAEVQYATDQLARHQIKAPFAGVVVDRNVELGQWLDMADPCYTVEDISRLRAVFAVPQQYYSRIQPDSQVILNIDALPGEVFKSELTRVLPRVNRQGRSFEVWVELDNADQRLVSGLSARVRLPLLTDAPGSVWVPRDAVQRGAEGKAWLWRAHRPESDDAAWAVTQVWVEVIAAPQEGLLVRGDGLAAGMRVVVRGNERLREGQQVFVLAGD